MSDTRDAPPTLNLKASLRGPIQWALSAGIVAALATLFMPNYYKSEARLLPVDPSTSGNFGGLAAAAAAFGVNVGGGSGSDANLVDILNSRWLKEHLLATEYEFNSRSWHLGSKVHCRETLYGFLGKKNMDRAVKKLDELLVVSKDMKSNVITITVETTSPELSQEVVHRATELLNQFAVNNSKTRGSEKAAFAESRLIDARKKMDNAEDQFKVFLGANRNYQMSTDPGVRLHGMRLESELNLRRQLVSTLALNREQALLDAKNDIPIITVLDPGNLPIDKSKPSRSILVVFVVAVVGIGSWSYRNWEWVKSRLLDGASS